MADTVQVLTHYPKQLIKELDELVAKGHYASRTDALRDSVRMLVRTQRGIMQTDKTGLELQKEGNRKMHERYLKLAGGDWEKAKRILLDDLKKIKI
ncbi:MAG: ribbon-helix-helix domain-containing protein [Candidatus Nanoarchaeia archaeon]|nr:ribbon-helix-helix domain-containing protein [Candidatus Nanoarchaeia archaeon]MDD5239233.1 ribbon-helix-helix domain-containing protein [Candidatus Nanoarchaeia archaeon]